MASAPFTIDITSPTDGDIKSLYPANERTFRDTVKSWLTQDGDTSNIQTRVRFAMTATDSTPASNIIYMRSHTDGVMYLRNVAQAATADSGLEVLGNDVGTVILHPAEGSGTIASPKGYLLCDGREVSRTTYSRLFAKVAEVFGVGDGATTFRIPNCPNLQTAAGIPTIGRLYCWIKY